MKRLFFAIFFTLLAAICYANPFMATVVQQDSPAAGATPTCVGYENDQTDCAQPTYGGSATTISADATVTRTWTASRNGTATSVEYYSTGCGTGNTFTVTLYVAGQLRGTGTSTCVADTWISGTLASYSGRSLSFSTSDVIKYGVSIDYVAGGTYVGRQSDAVNSNYYSDAAYSPDPFADTTTSAYELMAILHYEY